MLVLELVYTGHLLLSREKGSDIWDTMELKSNSVVSLTDSLGSRISERFTEKLVPYRSCFMLLDSFVMFYNCSGWGRIAVRGLKVENDSVGFNRENYRRLKINVLEVVRI